MKNRTLGDIVKIRKITSKLKALQKNGIITNDELMDILDILYRV